MHYFAKLFIPEQRTTDERKKMLRDFACFSDELKKKD